jgi:hypothetical protein
MIRRRSSTRPAGTSTCKSCNRRHLPEPSTAYVTTVRLLPVAHLKMRSSTTLLDPTVDRFWSAVPIRAISTSGRFQYCRKMGRRAAGIRLQPLSGVYRFTVDRSRRQKDNHQETCCLYAVKFINLDGINDLLLVSVDGGVYFFNWTKDVAPYLLE